jgi:hypothetical protein
MIPSSPIWGKSGTKTSPHQIASFDGFCPLKFAHLEFVIRHLAYVRRYQGAAEVYLHYVRR